ncbi:MAG: DUF2339 domain-containing protein [Mariniphaga sp.]
MTENNDRINLLLEKLNTLLELQDSFSKSINELGKEINSLKNTQAKEQFEDQKTNEPLRPEKVLGAEFIQPAVTIIHPADRQEPANETIKSSIAGQVSSPEIKSDLEKFIGENLINKIGIAITVIGVAIGAKYSIDHNLISPLTRILLGYLMAFGLLGTGIKLKANYENYSAVLVSGAMAIFYFITYLAFSLYHLIPQSFTFALMVVFTVFTVVAAINYNKQVIAHLGLVGAYAVPFMLSDESGTVTVLFSYMAIINAGILFISIQKYWKPLYYSSFLISWLIYFSWFSEKFQSSEHFGVALIFVTIFFTTFYAIFLAYKLLKKEEFELEDIILLIANSFIFYGIGYAILKSNTIGEELLGLFTFGNALIHLGASIIIYRQKLADRNLFYLVAGLVLVFITITIPVQLDGNWVTLLWAGEAALLFWIGRTKNVQFYELLSYVLIVLTFISIVQDWQTGYETYIQGNPKTRITPLLNINFLSSILVIGALGFINNLNRNPNYRLPPISKSELWRVISFLIPAVLLVVFYYSFRVEISTYWNQYYIDSAITVKRPNSVSSDSFQNTDLLGFQSLWIINYSLLFFALLSFANIKKFRDKDLGLLSLGLNLIVILVFLIQGLYLFGELRDSFLSHKLSGYYPKTNFYIGIRYVSYALVAIVFATIWHSIRQDFLKPFSLELKKAFDLLFYSSLLWIASSEMISWMDILMFSQSNKLGLSILWGAYALLLIALGIWKNKKHLRVGAIVLFAVTLVKLFFYDIADLDTIAKTIVFVSLGVILLIISFLYNKYKHLITVD